MTKSKADRREKEARSDTRPTKERTPVGRNETASRHFPTQGFRGLTPTAKLLVEYAKEALFNPLRTPTFWLCRDGWRRSASPCLNIKIAKPPKTAILLTCSAVGRL